MEMSSAAVVLYLKEGLQSSRKKRRRGEMLIKVGITMSVVCLLEAMKSARVPSDGSFGMMT